MYLDGLGFRLVSFVCLSWFEEVFSLVVGVLFECTVGQVEAVV